MSFKVHLIIVACIIAAVYVIWELMHAGSTAVTAQGDPRGIPRMIAVTHASYGLNCRNVAVNNDAVPQDAFNTGKTPNPKLAEDNVFSSISLKCNGATECDIPLDDPALGEDPAPGCTPKMLEVEYRCFSYDRPWRVRTSSGVIKLICATEKK